MNEMSDYLYNHDERYSDYIDNESFANWLLVNDILGVSDGCGTNMILSKYDYQNNNYKSSKLKMATNWDFDSQFNVSDWSQIHGDIWVYDMLFEFGDFKNTYVDKWKLKKDNLFQDLNNYLSSYINEYGKGIQESWILDSKRFKNSYYDIDELVLYTLDKIDERINFINDSIDNN